MLADLQETLGLWYDHVLISWSSEITVEGGRPASTRADFIDLFSNEDYPSLQIAFQKLVAAAGVASNFTKEAEAAAEKN